MLKIVWSECRDGMDDADFENGYRNDVTTVEVGNDKIFANVEGDSESGSYAIWLKDSISLPFIETKSYRSAKVLANKRIRELYKKMLTE
jgi:hypothetical protein